MNLEVISNKFPLQDEVEATNSIGTISSQQECLCHRRTKPPLPPTSLPYPTTEVNREKLQQYFLNYYGPSTFNTVPLMEGPPMRLMIDPQATPTAHHSPIPEPIHWEEDVKAGLDRDMRLGVPVLIGEPVTWCHRMVICAKKNSKPRRKIDFQSLNTCATRETHHTHCPFHQARSVLQGHFCCMEWLPQCTPSS